MNLREQLKKAEITHHIEPLTVKKIEEYISAIFFDRVDKEVHLSPAEFAELFYKIQGPNVGNSN